MADKDRLSRYGSAIWTASRNDEGTISATGANIVARAVMAVVDEEIRAAQAAAWDEGHTTWWRRGPDDCQCGAYYAGECACGRYGTGPLLSLASNPYRKEP